MIISSQEAGAALRIGRHAQILAARLNLADAWQIELAAMLSQIRIGFVKGSGNLVGRSSAHQIEELGELARGFIGGSIGRRISL